MSARTHHRRPLRRRRPTVTSLRALAAVIPAAGVPPQALLDLGDDGSEPAASALRLIEAEWPTYAAYLAVVDAECRFAASPDVLARRALRRAEVALARVLAERANTTRRTSECDPEPNPTEGAME